MKNITTLLSFFILFYGMMNAQERSATFVDSDVSVQNEPNAKLPAAYYNITQAVIGEEAKEVGTPPNFDPNISIPNTGIIGYPRGTEIQAVLYDNGSTFNIPGPPPLSMLQDGTLGMNTYGANADINSGYSMADDFELASESEITSIEFYSYQTGASAPTITGVYVQIWDGDPSGSGNEIWGDMFTNILFDSEGTGGYRQLESTPGDTSREIQLVIADTPGLTLDAGTYWVEVGFEGSSSSGPWAPPIVITGEATTGDGLQKTPTGWQAWLDTGTNTGQGVPFQIYGTSSGGGDPCENPILEIEQNIDDTCMADISQGGLAQSYIPLETDAAGAGIKFRETSSGLDVNLSLWDGLPNAGGTMLTSGTTQTDGTEWADVYWDSVVTVDLGETYYIVIDGDVGLPCVSGSTNNPYPDGMTFANDYGSFPDFDYTFRTYSCESLGIDNQEQIGFSYYPNPVGDVLNISAKIGIESVSAYNLLGQQVLNIDNLKNGQINVSSLSAGTYIFEVTLEGGYVETFKILK